MTTLTKLEKAMILDEIMMMKKGQVIHFGDNWTEVKCLVRGKTWEVNGKRGFGDLDTYCKTIDAMGVE